MEITQTPSENISVFSVKKDLTRGNVNELRQLFSAHVEEQKPAGIVLDCGQVTRADSSGLRFLLSLYDILKKTGLELVLTGVKNEVYAVMKNTRLNRVLLITPDIDTAKKELERRLSL